MCLVNMDYLHECVNCDGMYSSEEIVEYKCKELIFYYCKNCDDEIEEDDTDYEPTDSSESSEETEDEEL